VQYQVQSCGKYLLENTPGFALCYVADPTSSNVKEVPALSRANCLSPPPLANTPAELPGVRPEYLNSSYGKRWAHRGYSPLYGSLHAMSEPEGIGLTRELVTEGDSLDITVDDAEERAFVRLHGRLGIDSSPDLRDRLLAMLEGQPPKTIIVDLAEVSYIDASGIATLLEALKVARKRQVTFCLKGLHGRIVRLFEATGLLALFETAGCKEASPELR